MRQSSIIPRVRLSDINWQGVYLCLLLAGALIAILYNLPSSKAEEASQTTARTAHVISAYEFDIRTRNDTKFDAVFIKNVPDRADEAKDERPEPTRTLGLDDIRQISFPKQV